MTAWEYDGTFEGLLTAFAAAIDMDAHPDDIAPEGAQLALSGAGLIAGDPARAERLVSLLRTRCAPLTLKHILYCFLSETSGYERTLLEYIRCALVHGKRVDTFHANDAVRAVHELSRKVSGEIHRLGGLVRFRELGDGTFWAPVEPDHNVVCGVALHFMRRLPNQEWIIYDMRRGYGVRWDTHECTPVTMNEELDTRIRKEGVDTVDILSASEQKYQAYWRQYFEAISISARTNPRLQRRNMPQRYWRYLVERPAGGAWRAGPRAVGGTHLSGRSPGCLRGTRERNLLYWKANTGATGGRE